MARKEDREPGIMVRVGTDEKRLRLRRAALEIGKSVNTVINEWIDLHLPELEEQARIRTQGGPSDAL